MTIKRSILLASFAAILTPAVATAQFDEDPRVAAQKAADLAMAKALAAKARNDAIVAEQRRQEAARAKAASSDATKAKKR